MNFLTHNGKIYTVKDYVRWWVLQPTKTHNNQYNITHYKLITCYRSHELKNDSSKARKTKRVKLFSKGACKHLAAVFRTKFKMVYYQVVSHTSYVTPLFGENEKKNCKRGSWVCAKIILSGLTSKSVPVWFINRHNSVAMHFPKALMFSRRTSTIKTTNYREVSHSTCNSVLWEESLVITTIIVSCKIILICSSEY